MRLARGVPRQANRLASAVGDVSVLAEPGGRRALPADVDRRLTAKLWRRGLDRQIRDELARLAALGWVPIHREHPAYPPLLCEMGSPPPILAVRGELEVLREPCVAVVGTRRPSRYGRNMAGRIAGDLARRGVAVVSGLARGIDAEAHRTALEVGARTIAVMGTGPDVVYPEKHRDLAERIASSGGALITELPVGTPPRRQNFPMRNRIIAGLAAAVVVVEGAHKSGSLLTAGWALDEGREVLAVPGRAHEPAAEGTLQLIREGAAMACTGEDVLAELPEPLRGHLLGGWATDSEAVAAAPADPPLPPGIDDRCRALLRALSVDEETPLEELLETVEMPPDQVLTGLFALELAGLVESRPGQRYTLRPQRQVGHT